MSYQNILTAVDTFAPVENLLKDATTFATSMNAQQTLIHVTPFIPGTMAYPADLEQEMEENAKSTLNQALEAQGLKTPYELKIGRPHIEITNHAEQHQVDLIIAGSHGKHGMSRLLGSTAKGIVHHAQCDVLTFRVNKNETHTRPLPYQRILVATDFQNDVLIKKALLISDAMDAELHLVNVIPDGSALSVMMIPSLEIEDAIEQSARKKLTQIADKFSITEPYRHLYHGLPRMGILECAEKISADLVIIGKHGHSTLHDLVIGSTANALLHHTNTDLLVSHV